MNSLILITQAVLQLLKTSKVVSMLASYSPIHAQLRWVSHSLVSELSGLLTNTLFRNKSLFVGKHSHLLLSNVPLARRSTR